MSPVALMDTERQIIEQTMKRFGAPVRVRPAPFTYRTPRSNVYWIDRAHGVKIDKITGLDKELEEALTVIRGTKVPVRFLMPPLAVVTPRIDPVEVTAAELLGGVQKVSPGTVRLTLGQFFNHSASVSDADRLPKWLRVDLNQPETPNLLVVGVTGSGKTVVMKNAAFSLAVASDPERVAILAIDLKAVDGLPGLTGLPHLAHPVATDPDDAMRLLTAVVYEMERRKEQAKAANGQVRSLDWPAVVLFIDELSLLMDRGGKEANILIKQITTVGRGLRIHLVLGTQKPTKDMMSPETLANLPLRAVGSVSTRDEGYWATGIPGTQLGAEKLTGRGDMIMALNASRVWGFQSANIQPAHEPRIVQRVNDWWGGKRTRFRLVMDGEDDTTTSWSEVARPAQIAAPAPTVNVAALPAPKAPSRDNVVDRHEWTIAAIQAIVDDEGKAPSATRVQAIFKNQFDTGLNWNTACTLLKRAMGEAE